MRKVAASLFVVTSMGLLSACAAQSQVATYYPGADPALPCRRSRGVMPKRRRNARLK